MLMGIISHPFKALLFRLKGGASQYDGLKKRAIQRAENKALYRSMYIASVTNTKI